MENPTKCRMCNRVAIRKSLRARAIFCSEECRKKSLARIMRDWQRRRVAQRRIDGLCIGCAKRAPAKGGRAYCEECLVLHRSKYDRVSTRKRHRAWAMKKHYGISQDRYDKMLVAQGHACAICRQPAPIIEPTTDHRPYIGKLLRVDHDHKTGEVRGLLCHNCNTALGHLKDDPALFLKAVAYLIDHQAIEVIDVRTAI